MPRTAVISLLGGSPGVGKARARGNIDTLSSGALRDRAYAGIDPVAKKRHDLVEIVPPGPNARREAEKILDRFLHEIAEKRSPRTPATGAQLLMRYLEQLDGAPNVLTLYRAYVRNHVLPFLGHLKVGELNADVLDGRPGGRRPGIGSVAWFFWHEGQFGEAEEWTVSFKITEARYSEFESHLIANHEWTDPEVSAVMLSRASASYAEWGAGYCSDGPTRRVGPGVRTGGP